MMYIQQVVQLHGVRTLVSKPIFSFLSFFLFYTKPEAIVIIGNFYTDDVLARTKRAIQESHST